VLVPGTGGDAADNWGTYAALLHDNGYCVYALTYGVPPQLADTPFQMGGMNTMESSAAQLSQFVSRVLAATGASKVDLIGHSQGTLMPEYYVKFLGGATYVDHYISLAPLWHGEGSSGWGPEWWAFARALGFSNASQMPFCNACSEMLAGSAFMDKVRAGGLAVPGVTYTNIVTEHDEMVSPYTSGIETGMTNIDVQNGCPQDLSDHLEIASDPVAAAYVLNALDPGHPRPVPCELVLPIVGPTPQS
jgi:triacylglycerol lipase